jgi:mannose-1-phosphate guanylyltransferase
MTRITPVLMSGGAGTRLWPLSRQAQPKQFHTAGRRADADPRDGPQGLRGLVRAAMVVCNVAHADLVREQLAAVGIAAKA